MYAEISPCQESAAFFLKKVTLFSMGLPKEAFERVVG